jgi:hypothetical protein
MYRMYTFSLEAEWILDGRDDQRMHLGLIKEPRAATKVLYHGKLALPYIAMYGIQRQRACNGVHPKH